MYSVPKSVNLKHLPVNWKFMLSGICTKVLILRRHFHKKRNNTNSKHRRETISKYINFEKF